MKTLAWWIALLSAPAITLAGALALAQSDTLHCDSAGGDAFQVAKWRAQGYTQEQLLKELDPRLTPGQRAWVERIVDYVYNHPGEDVVDVIVGARQACITKHWAKP